MDTLAFLKGKRVALRPVLKADLPHFMRWLNDPAMTQYLAAYLPVMEGDEEEWLEGLRKKKSSDLVFSITLANGTLIGVMGLHRIDWKDRTASTGSFIGEKKHWGKGYGTEAKMLLLDYAFHTLNLRKICASYIAFNVRSGAYQKKCGYREEGRQKLQRFRNGRYWDEILTAVFKEDWLPLWEKYRRKYFRRGGR